MWSFLSSGREAFCRDGKEKFIALMENLLVDLQNGRSWRQREQVVLPAGLTAFCTDNSKSVVDVGGQSRLKSYRGG